MKLSEKGYEYVNRLWNKKVPFLNLRLNDRIEQLTQSGQRSELPLRMFADLFLEHYQATLDALLQCYLEAYQLEKKIIEESDINGIIAQGFYHWDNHWQMVFQLNPDLIPEREYIQSRQRPLIANMRNDLLIEVNKMDLERQASPPVVPQTIRSEKDGHLMSQVHNDSAPDTTQPRPPVEVFYSYSHKDEEFLEKLITHLSVLKRTGMITGWHDRQISAGREWKNRIDEHLESAGVILLLVSADFLASDYCYDLEMARAMARHDEGTARVIPIILRNCDWSDAPFGKLQALPKNAKPVKSWSDQDDAFTDIATGIKRAIAEIVP